MDIALSQHKVRPEPPIRTVGLLGAGVIGGGWAARFVLNGIDVRIYDPDPDAARKVSQILDNARHALGRLTLAPLPVEGSIAFVRDVEAAVADVDFVQESAPERVELKQELLARAAAAACRDVVFASSTSGLRPSLLQEAVPVPERLIVGHPFNPVYLLPLVEVCGGTLTAPVSAERAAEVYRSVGMHPLTVRHETDGFIADRLLESLWREALWLVADGAATVEEIDDAIRYGPGLRWSAMGTFLTYRIAGGEGGIRDFMAQFGPALQWPWSHLTEVPELTDELLDTIERQSDAQAAGRSVQELERLRDDCLVDVLQALRANDIGAGTTLRAYERRLLDGKLPVDPEVVGSAEPLSVYETRVQPSWVDHNGHAHESAYLRLTGDATDALLRVIGVDSAYLAGGGSYFTVETHICHLHEMKAGEPVRVTTQVLGADEKRLHVFHRVLRTTDGEELATVEQMLLHVDTVARRAAPANSDVLARARALAEAHRTLEQPDRVGRRISSKGVAEAASRTSGVRTARC
jgi:carnitine 3-dehydrogenase / betainyl-CoA thioesterase